MRKHYSLFLLIWLAVEVDCRYVLEGKEKVTEGSKKGYRKKRSIGYLSNQSQYPNYPGVSYPFFGAGGWNTMGERRRSPGDYGFVPGAAGYGSSFDRTNDLDQYLSNFETGRWGSINDGINFNPGDIAVGGARQSDNDFGRGNNFDNMFSIFENNRWNSIMGSAFGEDGRAANGISQSGQRRGSDLDDYFPNFGTGRLNPVDEGTRNPVTERTRNPVTETTRNLVTGTTRNLVTETTQNDLTNGMRNEATPSSVTEGTQSTVTEGTSSTVTERTSSTVTEGASSTETDRWPAVENSADDSGVRTTNETRPFENLLNSNNYAGNYGSNFGTRGGNKISSSERERTEYGSRGRGTQLENNNFWRNRDSNFGTSGEGRAFGEGEDISIGSAESGDNGAHGIYVGKGKAFGWGRANLG